MFYKPTYCCHCGEKIEKTEHLPRLKSGRFCDACRKEFPLQEWLPRVCIVLCAVFGLFGIGAYMQRAEPARSAGLRQNRTVIAPGGRPSTAPGENDNRSENAANRKNGADDAVNSSRTASVDLKSGETGEREPENVSFCGAATKKGTPCSRKVKGGGRCWQHKGKETPPGEEKLSTGR